MPTQKIWDHVIDMKKGFVPRKGKVYLLLREERRSKRIHTRTTKERIYPTLKVTSNGASILCRKEGWEEIDGTELQIFK